MKIVIDISKDDFEKIKNTSFVENTETMLHQSSEDRKGTMMLFRVMDAIKEGTPLPEHHGRLIDADAFIERTERIYKQTGYVLGVYDIEEEPTIIERGEKRTCANCILNGTNACSRGAGTVIDDRVCEDYLEGVRASD